MEQGFVGTIAQMNFAVIIAVTLLSAFLALALYRVALRNPIRTKDPSDSKSLIEPLDVLAFNNLIDPAEEDFLRQALPPPVFRSIQRLRLRAAIEYVSCASRNAVLLIRMGKLASAQASIESPSRGRELATAAVQLRFLSLLVLCLLWVKMAFPGLRLSLQGISALHERLVTQQAALGRLKTPERLLSSVQAEPRR